MLRTGRSNCALLGLLTRRHWLCPRRVADRTRGRHIGHGIVRTNIYRSVILTGRFTLLTPINVLRCTVATQLLVSRLFHAGLGDCLGCGLIGVGRLARSVDRWRIGLRDVG